MNVEYPLSSSQAAFRIHTILNSPLCERRLRREREGKGGDAIYMSSFGWNGPNSSDQNVSHAMRVTKPGLATVKLISYLHMSARQPSLRRFQLYGYVLQVPTHSRCFVVDAVEICTLNAFLKIELQQHSALAFYDVVYDWMTENRKETTRKFHVLQTIRNSNRKGYKTNNKFRDVSFLFSNIRFSFPLTHMKNTPPSVRAMLPCSL